MEGRGKRALLGCGLGCLAVVVLGISSCVGFRMWLSSPGELLEPNVLLDPEAVGWAQARLDLEDEGTEALASALLQLTRPPEGMFEGSPFLAFFDQMNSRRQERQMRRLFPLTASWSLYPGEDGGAEPILITASVPRMAHTLALVDWGLGFITRRQPELESETYRGERILVFREPPRRRGVGVSFDAGGVRVERESELGSRAEAEGQPLPEADDSTAEPEDEPLTAYLFLRDVGVFFATSSEAAHRAIDDLEGGPAQASGAPLERLVGGLDEAPVRAALVNDAEGRLSRVLGRLLPEGVLDDETRMLLDRSRSATLIGRLDSEGGLELTVSLAGVVVGDEEVAVLEGAVDRLLTSADVGGSAAVEASAEGVRAVLTLPIREAAEQARSSWR